MSTSRLFPSTNGPSAPVSTSGGWLLGVMFSVTGQMCWLNGYYFWVCPGGDTGPQKFALWNRYSSSAQALVSGSVVTSGTLTAGTWNYVPLSAPVQLGPGALYAACTGWNAVNGIPLTAHEFGSGNPYAAGIVNGPLTAWSDSTNGGTNDYGGVTGATPNAQIGQGLFSNSLGADPSAAMPNQVANSDNFWMDVLISTTPPAGYAGSYRFHPNMAELGNWAMDTANGFTLGREFSLSQPCSIGNIWFYSPAGVSQLPTEIGVYKVATQTLAASNSSPAWSGAAGSGWVKASLSGALQAGVNYKAVVFQGSNVIWNGAVNGYWTSGFGANGLTAGPLSAPANASASPGQDSYNLGASIAYPGTIPAGGGYSYGIDIEVTPVAAGSGLLMAAFP